MQFRLLLVASLACLLAVWSGFARAQLAEGDVKAAFVYNFAKFVEWPAEALGPAGGPLWVCAVGGPDPLLSALPRLEGKQAQGREIRVRSAAPRAEALRGCHVMVVGESEALRMAEDARLAALLGVLSISAVEHFVDAGGMIGLVVQDNRVQFEINLDATQKANLKPAAQFVKLARNVRK